MAKAPTRYSIGVDYGTNSVRAVIVDTRDGNEIATAVYNYPTGKDGVILDAKDPNLARQNPDDYIKGFLNTVKRAVVMAKKKRGFSTDRVVGIGVDTTGSTPIPVDRDGTALAMLPQFKKNPHAHAWLWKDHTGHAEAAEITAKAAKHKDGYLLKCGGTYSSEWYWSKILRCKRVAPKVFDAAYTWVEQSDFIPAYLTGNTDPDTMPRNICAGGHKAMFHEQWGGLPSKAFLKSLDPALPRLRDPYQAAQTSDQSAGTLRADLARKVGLPSGIPVAVGLMDAHAGAVGSGVKPGTLVKIMGTSTCDITVWPLKEKLGDIPGLCGIVPGSVLPDAFGLEAGQSAVGDLFNWYVQYQAQRVNESPAQTHARLNKEAIQLNPGASGLLALDWNNGNRTVLVDPLLTGLLVGQTLHTTHAEIYRALIEATAFGALRIIEQFESHGVAIKQIVTGGGITEKSPMTMQIYADVCNRPFRISGSSQTCALGAAIFGSVVGGAHRSVASAQKAMTGLKSTVYRPRKASVKVYAQLYRLYCQLHDAFGVAGSGASVDHVMKELIAIRNAQR